MRPVIIYVRRGAPFLSFPPSPSRRTKTTREIPRKSPTGPLIDHGATRPLYIYVVVYIIVLLRFGISGVDKIRVVVECVIVAYGRGG